MLNDTTNFERSNPGQGHLLDYTLPGWKLDVFVYDLRRIAIPDDARSAIVRAEFERSREDAFLSAPRGPYAQVFLRRNFTIDDGKKVTRFQCAAFHMRRDGAKPQDGFLCVTSLRNKFIKLRLTTLAHQGTETQARQPYRGLDSCAVGRRQRRGACAGRGQGGRAAPACATTAVSTAPAACPPLSSAAALHCSGRACQRRGVRDWQRTPLAHAYKGGASGVSAILACAGWFAGRSCAR